MKGILLTVIQQIHKEGVGSVEQEVKAALFMKGGMICKSLDRKEGEKPKTVIFSLDIPTEIIEEQECFIYVRETPEEILELVDIKIREHKRPSFLLEKIELLEKEEA